MELYKLEVKKPNSENNQIIYVENFQLIDDFLREFGLILVSKVKILMK